MTGTEWEVAAEFYGRLGWRPGVFGSAVWVVASRPVEALEFPASLGVGVVDLLAVWGVPGPVFQVGGGAEPRWVVLTGRRDDGWHTVAGQLTEADVVHVWADVTLHLPPTRIGRECLSWVLPPVSPSLPTLSMVARAVLAALSP